MDTNSKENINWWMTNNRYGLYLNELKLSNLCLELFSFVRVSKSRVTAGLRKLTS